MTNKELKERIQSNTLDNQPLILKYIDTKFICNQYINQISKNKGLNITYINSAKEALIDPDSFDSIDDKLFVLDVEELKEIVDDTYKNLIILTKKVPDNLSIDYIDMVKIEPQHIEDYVKYRVPGLDENELKWLCKVTKYDIYRLEMECNKLALFPEASQSNMFKQISAENGYSDLTDNTIFTFCDAIIKKDLNLVGELIPEINEADLEPLGCVTILLKKFKQMCEFLLNPKATATSCKMTEKQFYFLKKHPEKFSSYNTNEIIKNIEFLTNLDYKVKSGNLDLSRERLLDYIVSNILN